jgi:hypothetical protein
LIGHVSNKVNIFISLAMGADNSIAAKQRLEKMAAEHAKRSYRSFC